MEFTCFVEKFSPSRHHISMTELERSHAELRVGVLLAGKEIRKLNFDKTTNPVLTKLRQVLPDDRVVAEAERISERIG